VSVQITTLPLDTAKVRLQLQKKGATPPEYRRGSSESP